MTGLKKLRGGGYESARTQDFTGEALKKLSRDNPILDSNTVTAEIGTSDTEVDHGLGRATQGWVVVDKNANADVWKSTTTNAAPERKVILKASATVTAKILFY